MHCFYVLLCYKHFLWHFPLRHHSSNFGFPFNSFIILRGCFYTFYTYIFLEWDSQYWFCFVSDLQLCNTYLVLLFVILVNFSLLGNVYLRGVLARLKRRTAQKCICYGNNSSFNNSELFLDCVSTHLRFQRMVLVVEE